MGAFCITGGLQRRTKEASSADAGSASYFKYVEVLFQAVSPAGEAWGKQQESFRWTFRRARRPGTRCTSRCWRTREINERRRLGVAVIAVDIADQEAARRILGDVRPEVLVLNAGTPPRTWGGSTSCTAPGRPM